MGHPYDNPGFSDDNIHHEPGCAIWTDAEGTIILGFTREGAVLTQNPNAQAVTADESGSTPLHHITLGDTVRIEFTMLQTSLARMQRVLPSASYSGGLIRFGNVPGTMLPRGRIVHRPFAYPDGSRDLVIGNATNVAEQSFAHKHNEPNTVNCTFEGVLDETQDPGALTNAGIGT